MWESRLLHAWSEWGSSRHAGTIFPLGKQKRLFGCGSIIGEKKSRRSNWKYNFVQKKVYAVYSGVWGFFQKLGILENFRAKNSLTVYFEVTEQIREQDVLVAAPIILLLPRFPRLWFQRTRSQSSRWCLQWAEPRGSSISNTDCPFNCEWRHRHGNDGKDIDNEQQLEKIYRRLHYVVVVMHVLAILFRPTLHHFDLLYDKCTTNRSNRVWALQRT